MKILVEEIYQYDIILDGYLREPNNEYTPWISKVKPRMLPEGYGSRWNEVNVNTEQLIDLINKGVHIKINCE